MAAVALLAVVGCGGHLALTGGSIPIGTSRLQGIVVRAENVSIPLSGARLALQSDGKITYRESDPKGRFDFGNVPGGLYLCTVQPGSISGAGAGWAWFFTLSEDTSGYMICSVWPKLFNTASVDRVVLEPPEVKLKVGESVRFASSAFDKTGKVIPFRPSLLLEGGVGTLSVDGTFYANRRGKARVIAWMAGKAIQSTIEVVE